MVQVGSSLSARCTTHEPNLFLSSAHLPIHIPAAPKQVRASCRKLSNTTKKHRLQATSPDHTQHAIHTPHVINDYTLDHSACFMAVYHCTKTYSVTAWWHYTLQFACSNVCTVHSPCTICTTEHIPQGTPCLHGRSVAGFDGHSRSGLTIPVLGTRHFATRVCLPPVQVREHWQVLGKKQ